MTQAPHGPKLHEENLGWPAVNYQTSFVAVGWEKYCQYIMKHYKILTNNKTMQTPNYKRVQCLSLMAL